MSLPEGLHPQARKALEAQADDVAVTDPAYDIDAERAKAVAFNLKQPREDVASVSDVDAGGVPCRLYRPAGSEEGAPLGVVVHLHGGGFVFNDVDVHDALARALANRSRLAVLSVGYRRPPEDRYPAAVEDTDAVLAWVFEHGADHDLDGTDVHLHGDSAGACLAYVGARHHRDRIRSVALVYPFIDATMAGDSWAEPLGSFDVSEGRWYWEQYAGGADALDRLKTDPDFSPAVADDLAGLPPTLVVTAEFDPCRDEGEALYRRLAEAGVVAVGNRVLGQIHSFYRHLAAFDAADPTLRGVAAFLVQHAR